MKNKLSKFFRFIFFAIIGIIISLNLFVILSGRFYLYKGFANTYMIGRTGPSIYDLHIFENDTLNHATETDQWAFSHYYNQQKIPKDYREYMESLGTTAFLVIHEDSILYEEYWDAHDSSTVSNSFSMAKSVVSMLIGIAQEEGHIGSLDDKVSKYIPEFNNGKRNIVTIRNLLTMSSGLDWQESGKNPLSDNAESYYGDDLYNEVTRQKLISEPGKLFNYQSGNTQLLGFILKAATGKSVSDYADEKIWSQIGTESDAYWSLDRKGGDDKAFCCLYATAKDFARLGVLVNNNGKYAGKQIIPESYMKEMVTPANLMTEEGIPNERYGLQMWMYFGGADPAYYFRGILGQYIISIPEENLIIVRLGSERNPNFVIPDHMKGNKEYVTEHSAEVGHPLDFFQYIALGKMIVSQTELYKQK